MPVILIAANGFLEIRRVSGRVGGAGILGTICDHQLSLYKPAAAASIFYA
jgi:hypothetical protein